MEKCKRILQIRGDSMQIRIESRRIREIPCISAGNAPVSRRNGAFFIVNCLKRSNI